MAGFMGKMFGSKIPGGEQERPKEQSEGEKKERVEGLRGESAELMNEGEKLKAQFETLSEELSKVMQEIGGLEDEARKLGSGNAAEIPADLLARRDALNAEWEKQMPVLVELGDRINRLNNRADALENHGVDLEAREQELKSSLAELSPREEELGAEIAKRQGVIDANKNVVAQFDRERDALVASAVSRGDSPTIFSRADTSGLRDMLSAHQTRIEQYQAELSAINSKRSELSSIERGQWKKE